MQRYHIPIICLVAALLLPMEVTAQESPKLGAKPAQMMIVAIEVADAAASGRFYTEILGMQENSPKSGNYSFSGSYDDTYFKIIQSKAMPADNRLGKLSRLAFKVPDLRAIIVRARGAGVTILREPAISHGNPNMTVAFVRDPDGIPIELIEIKGT